MKRDYRISLKDTIPEEIRDRYPEILWGETIRLCLFWSGLRAHMDTIKIEVSRLELEIIRIFGKNWGVCWVVGRNRANWIRVDLHLHSPGVHTFKLPDGVDITTEKGRKTVVEKFVTQLKNQGIKICAITDYNGIRKDWFELIRDYALERGIYVFPGVELSFNESGGRGLHILVIFPYDVDIDGVNNYIQGWDRDREEPLFSDREQHRDISSDKPVENLLKELREKFNCLIIIPHPEDSNGFLKHISLKQQ
ncbi:MAG: hypothetical protein J7K36_04770 [Archaeoglobaceae archaeon]|nr:hypothetical protein [Archaeoglobaceae archaeon]